EALRPLQAARQQHVAERAAYTQNRIQQQKNQRDALLHASQSGAITKPWLSYCLGHLANQHRGRIVSELTTLPQFAGLTHAESYYQEALAGGLGEALPIALGLQLARREELIIAAVGDGSYLFANPAVCHHIAEVMKLPVLVVVGNNGGGG
ncbi:acetolactate synthase, partial [Klebsiella pneumoniae]